MNERYEYDQQRDDEEQRADAETLAAGYHQDLRDAAYPESDNNACVCCGGPVERDFLVTATVQIVVRAEDEIEARIIVASDLDDYIAQGSSARNDPMNGRIVTAVEDLTIDEF